MIIRSGTVGTWIYSKKRNVMTLFSMLLRFHALNQLLIRFSLSAPICYRHN